MAQGSANLFVAMQNFYTENTLRCTIELYISMFISCKVAEVHVYKVLNGQGEHGPTIDKTSFSLCCSFMLSLL